MTVYNGPFSEIPPFRYNFIMADPPWAFENWSKKGSKKNASDKYSCMALDEIKQLPVGHIARPDTILWLWATNPMLPHALEVIDAWGFTFKTAGHWGKVSENNTLSFGTGYLLRSAGEPFLIGTIGKPKNARNVRSLILAPRREHSRKPDRAYYWAEQLLPGATRIELFSRQPREGWDSWGDEVEKFA